MSDAAVETICSTIIFLFLFVLFFGNPFAKE